MPRVKLFDEQHVLTKAMNLFWKQGYADTSVQDLVSHLGINRASIYSTFGDKEQLFRQSIELYMRSNQEGLITFFQSHSNVKEGFAALFESAVNEAITDVDKKGCFAVNTTTELIPNNESLIEVLAQNKKQLESIFYNYLKKGKENGQLKKAEDLKSLASFLYMLFNGIRVVGKVQPNKRSLKKSIQVALTLLD